MTKSLAVSLLLAVVGFAAALGPSTKFVIRTIPQAKAMSMSGSTYDQPETNSYSQPASDSYNQPPPPPSPPSSSYGQSSSSNYGSSSSSSGYGSSSSAYADPTACQSNAECAAVDVNAECRYAKCQCKAPFVAEDVGLSPITTMSMRSALLNNRIASTVYLPPPTVNITCVKPFALLNSQQTCLIQTSCCLTADEQARLDALSACSVAPDPTTLAAFNSPPPTVSYTLVGSPADISIDAITGAVTVNASFTGSSATVTVQATLSSNPPQTATAQVTLLVNQDQCCILAPAQTQQQVTYELLHFFFELEFVGVSISDFILLDLSGNTVPTYGPPLSELFDGPCNKDISLVSAALAPTTDPTDFCAYLMIDSNNQLVFQTSAEDPTYFSDALSAALGAGTLDGVTAKCAINVVVASCNGNLSNATVTVAFTVPNGILDGLAALLEQNNKTPHAAAKVPSRMRKDKKKQKFDSIL